MFGWLRTKIRNAVLAGINDAVVYLENQGADDADDAQRTLEERLRLLPAPEPEKVRKSKAS